MMGENSTSVPITDKQASQPKNFLIEDNTPCTYFRASSRLMALTHLGWDYNISSKP
jgi:hypothetical protein